MLWRRLRKRTLQWHLQGFRRVWLVNHPPVCVEGERGSVAKGPRVGESLSHLSMAVSKASLRWAVCRSWLRRDALENDTRGCSVFVLHMELSGWCSRTQPRREEGSFTIPPGRSVHAISMPHYPFMEKNWMDILVSMPCQLSMHHGCPFEYF